MKAVLFGRNTAYGCAKNLEWRKTAKNCMSSHHCIYASLKFCQDKKGIAMTNDLFFLNLEYTACSSLAL